MRGPKLFLSVSMMRSPELGATTTAGCRLKLPRRPCDSVAREEVVAQTEVECKLSLIQCLH